VNLSPEQQKVVETWGRGMSVMAGAGSGKTTTLVIKCAELLRRDPAARFAAVSFTEKSASDLRGKLSQLLSLNGEGGTLSGHWVMTIHGLCAAILREYPREAGYDGEETMLSESESQLLWERAIEQVWSDEAQPEIQTALERMLGRENRDSLWGLLRRLRDLHSGGILESLGKKDEDSKALASLATFVLERYDRLKRRRGSLDFNDLERGADLALENPAVREAYQKRFALVLIDEFQDTNPVQARIILRFVKPDLSNLCVVGDPKQSIYRFRDADVSVFQEFCTKLPVNLSLTWNFRSRPGILDFTNRVCEKAFGASPPGLMTPYEALVPKREAHPESSGGPPGAQPDHLISPVLKLDVQSPADLANWILAERAKGVPLQDMALLLRKIRGNEYWLKALTAAGIPIAVGSGGLFWEDPRTREMVSFLKWWGNPANTLSGAIFLRAPWVGVADSDLDRWHDEDPTWVKPFFSSGHPLAKALENFRNRIVKPGDLLMALLLPDSDAVVGEKIEAELGATLLGLWHRVEDLSSRGLDFHAVVAELALATEEKRREKEVPPPRNDGQLSVLTLHGSKGLEFPHVILVDLGKKNRASNSPTLFWDRTRGAYLVQKDSDGERIEDPIFEEWKKDERAKELAESKRVFYVALTRAQERLVLVCPELPPTKEKAEKNPDEVYEQDFWRGWIEFSGALEGVPAFSLPGELSGQVSHTEKRAQPETESFTRKSIAPNRFPVSRPRHSVTEWNLLSRCPRAYEWTYVRPGKIGAQSGAGSMDGNQVKSHRDFDWLTPPTQDGDEKELSQRDLGTEVHACLEKGDYERLERLEKRAGSDRFQAARVRQGAENSPYMNAGAGLIKRAWSELAFEIPVGDEILVGSMDRAIETDFGYSVIDFKVTRHEKSVEALKAAYQTQMELYRFALNELNAKAGENSSDSLQIEAILVGFSDLGVQEIKLDPAHLNVENLAIHAAKIIRGEEGIPTPSSLCDVCQFRLECPASGVR
jgi:ATP-dependent exoDNAse (exonuclease V) beta subunit